MNPRLNDLFARRSVRVYRQQDVADDLVRDLLEAAMAAPSAVAKDPWVFVVVRTATCWRRSPRVCRTERCSPTGRWASSSAATCSGHTTGSYPICCRIVPPRSRICSWRPASWAWGACWLGVHPREERVQHIRSLLDIPEPVIPLAAIAIGWPAESPEPRTRYREDAVHRETW